jgi:hypothetical protein
MKGSCFPGAGWMRPAAEYPKLGKWQAETELPKAGGGYVLPYTVASGAGHALR